MRQANRLVAGLAVLASAMVQAQEKKMTHAQLPGPVAASLDRETQGSIVKGFSTEKEGGKTVYEAETTVSGHTRDVSVAADGTLLEVEGEVTMSALPEEVRNALTAKAKGAEITKVESLTKKGALVAYEAATLKGGKKGEIQVGPRGERLNHEE